MAEEAVLTDPETGQTTEVVSPPDDDWVYCHVQLGDEIVRRFAAHRWL